MNEKELYKFWKKYIDRNLYRVVSSEYISKIKRNGIDPKKNPYQNKLPDVKKLFSLVLKLEKKGFIHRQDWGFKKVMGKYIVTISSEDINSLYIDFTPNYKETYYYRKLKGGALVATIKQITTDILKRKPRISSSELLLVRKLHSWALHKSNFKNKTLFVKGSSKYFENSLFQIRLGKKGVDKYWKSPFGRFGHFKDIIKNYVFKKYKPYLTGKRLFYLRITNKIPTNEVYKII